MLPTHYQARVQWQWQTMLDPSYTGPDHPGLVLYQFEPLAAARAMPKAPSGLSLSLKGGAILPPLENECILLLLLQPTEAQIETTAPKKTAKTQK